jgi:hypothetical protein
MVSSCLRSRGQARPFGDIFPERAWVAVPENRENLPTASHFAGKCAA